MDRFFRRMLWSCVVGASGLHGMARADEPPPLPRPSADARLEAIEAELSALLKKLRAPQPLDELDVERRAPELMPEPPRTRATIPAARPMPRARAIPDEASQELLDFEDPFDDGPVVATQYEATPRPAPVVPAVPPAPAAFETQPPEQQVPRRVNPRATSAQGTPSSRSDRLKRLEQEIEALKATRPAPVVADEFPEETEETSASNSPQSDAASDEGSVGGSVRAAADSAPPVVIAPRPPAPATAAAAPQARAATNSGVPHVQVTPGRPLPRRTASVANPTAARVDHGAARPSDAVATRLERLEQELRNIRQEQLARNPKPEQASPPQAAAPAAEADDVAQAAPDAFEETPAAPTTPPRTAARTSDRSRSLPAAASHTDPFADEPIPAPPPPAKPSPRSAVAARPSAPAAAPKVRATPSPRPTPKPAAAEPATPSPPTAQAPARPFPTRRIPATSNEMAPTPPDPRLHSRRDDSHTSASYAPPAAPQSASRPSHDPELVGASGQREFQTPVSANEDEPETSSSGTPREVAAPTADWMQRREALAEEILRTRRSAPARPEQRYAARPEPTNRVDSELGPAAPATQPEATNEAEPKGATIAPPPPADRPPVNNRNTRPKPTDSLGPSTSTPPETDPIGNDPTEQPTTTNPAPAAPFALSASAATSNSPTAPRRVARSPRGSSSGSALFGAQDIDALFGGSNGTFYAGYDLLVLQPRFENSEGLVISPALGLTSSKSFDFDYELSPRAFVGFALESGLGARFQAWQFDHGTRISELSAAAGGVRTPAISPSGAVAPLAAAAGEELRAEHSLQFQSYDLEATWQQQFRQSAVTIAGGIRYLHMEQRYDVQRVTGAGAINGTLRHDHDFEGVGPTIAAEWLCPFGDSGLSFFAGGRGSVLVGSRNQVATIVDGGVTQDFNIDQPGQVGIGEAGLGLQYCSGALSLRAGYEGQIWTDVGSATTRTGNMALHGFSASFGFSY